MSSFVTFPLIYRELYEAALQRSNPSRRGPLAGDVLEFQSVDPAKRKQALVAVIASLWSPEAHIMSRLVSDSKKKPMQRWFRVGTLMDSLVGYLSSSTGSLAQVGRSLFDEKNSVPVISILPLQEEATAPSTTKQVMQEEKMEQFESSYERIYAFVAKSSKERDQLISIYNQASLDLYALSFFKDWSTYAFGFPIEILKIRAELQEIKRVLDERFKHLHLTDKEEAPVKKEYDALALRFKILREKLLNLEENASLFAIIEELKRKILEYSPDVNKKAGVKVAADPSSEMNEDLMEEAKLRQEKMAQTCKLLYEHVLHIFTVVYPEVLTTGWCLENELAILSFVFELKIPANHLASTCRSIAPRFDAAMKALGSDPKKSDLVLLHQQWFEEFKKQVEARDILQRKNDLLVPKLNMFFSGTLVRRVCQLRSNFEDIRIFNDCYEEMDYRKKQFLEGLKGSLDEITQLLEQEAWSKSFTSLDYIESVIKWMEAEAWRVSWPAYYAMHKGSAADWLHTARVEKTEQDLPKRFKDVLSALPYAVMDRPLRPQMAQRQIKPKSPTIENGKNLFESTRNIALVLNASRPKSPFFDCLYQAMLPTEEELFGNWQEIDSHPMIDLDIGKMGTILQDIEKSVLASVEWSNLLVNSCNLCTVLMVALEHSTEFVERCDRFQREESECAVQLAELKDKLKPFESLEYSQEDQLSDNQLALFRSIKLPKVLCGEVLLQNKKELIQTMQALEAQKCNMLSLRERRIKLEFLETSKKRSGEWVHRGTESIRKQELQVLNGLKQQLSSSSQAIPDTLNTIHHYFRIHYLFHVTAEANRIFTESATLKKGAEDLSKVPQNSTNKKLELSARTREIQTQEFAGSYAHWQGVFSRCLERVAEFHRIQSEVGQTLQTTCSKLMTDLELLKFYAASKDTLALFEEAKLGMKASAARLVKQTEFIRTNIDENLASTAKFLDAVYKKQKTKEKKSETESKIAHKSDNPNAALWDSHQKRLKEEKVENLK